MLAVQLGYKEEKVLTRYFDEFRAKLLARRRALARSQIAQMRRELLQSYTRMEPAPSMAEVCRKLGLKPLTTSRKFPAEYGLIVSRYQQRLPDHAETATDPAATATVLVSRSSKSQFLLNLGRQSYLQLIIFIRDSFG
jgi:AraC-like DNA-binding protein